MNLFRLRKDQDKGVKAKQLLDNEIFQECFDLQIKTITDQWQSENDPQVRERLWYLLQGTEGAKEVLKAIVGKGVAADKAIAQEAKK
jgi:hypothetical protein